MNTDNSALSKPAITTHAQPGARSALVPYLAPQGRSLCETLGISRAAKGCVATLRTKPAGAADASTATRPFLSSTKHPTTLAAPQGTSSTHATSAHDSQTKKSRDMPGCVRNDAI
jgi:hypothetical protein